MRYDPEQKQTNGDLNGFDVGQLADHLRHYVWAHGWDDYAESVFELTVDRKRDYWAEKRGRCRSRFEVSLDVRREVGR